MYRTDSIIVPSDNLPLIIPFGLASSGKKLLVVRLAMYLYCNHCLDIQASPHFVLSPSSLTEYYRENCSRWERIIHTGNICDGFPKKNGLSDLSPYVFTCRNNYGNVVCHLVALTGEICYCDASPVWSQQLSSLFATPNKKIWLILLEKDTFSSQNERDEYARVTKRMLNNISPKDKVIFVFNKADIYINKYVKDKHIDMKSFMKDINLQYPNLFDSYKSKGVAKFFKGEYNFNYMFFSSGVFTNARYIGMDDVWTPSPDIYCKNLWKKLKALL